MNILEISLKTFFENLNYLMKLNLTTKIDQIKTLYWYPAHLKVIETDLTFEPEHLIENLGKKKLF